MTATYVIGAWFAIATILTVVLGRVGYLRKLIRKMQLERQLRQYAGHDFAELGGLSQRHAGGDIA